MSHTTRDVCECGIILKQCRCPTPKTDIIRKPCPRTGRHNWKDNSGEENPCG